MAEETEETRSTTIVGTIHTSKESGQHVRRKIETEQPDIVAVELDLTRFQNLENNNKNVSFSDLSGPLRKKLIEYLLIRLHEKIASENSILSEERDQQVAVQTAKENGIDIALVDADIQNTLSRYISKASLKEYLTLLFSGTIAFFSSITGAATKEVEDMDDAEIEELMDKTKKYSPTFYEVFIKERNFQIAANIKALQTQFPEKDILVFVGRGHKNGVKELLDNSGKLDEYTTEMQLKPTLTIIEVPQKTDKN